MGDDLRTRVERRIQAKLASARAIEDSLNRQGFHPRQRAQWAERGRLWREEAADLTALLELGASAAHPVVDR